MNKQPILLALIAVIIIAGLFYWFTNKGLVTSVSSADGLVTLHIPDAALPSEVSVEDITIANLDVTEGDVGVLGMYEFGPSGTTFSEPVTVQINVAGGSNEGGVPLLVNIDEEVPEVVQNSAYIVESENSATLYAKLDHFSRYAVVHGFFDIIFTDDFGVKPKGARFPVNAEVAIIDEAPEQRIDGRMVRLNPKFNSRATPQWSADGSVDVVPIQLEEGETLSQELRGGPVTFTTEVDCSRSGSGEVTTTLGFSYAYRYLDNEGLDPDEGDSYTTEQNYVRVSLPTTGYCEDKEQDASPLLVRTECDGSTKIGVQFDKIDEQKTSEEALLKITSSQGEVLERNIFLDDFLAEPEFRVDPLPGVMVRDPDESERGDMIVNLFDEQLTPGESYTAELLHLDTLFTFDEQPSRADFSIDNCPLDDLDLDDLFLDDFDLRPNGSDAAVEPDDEMTEPEDDVEAAMAEYNRVMANRRLPMYKIGSGYFPESELVSSHNNPDESTHSCGANGQGFHYHLRNEVAYGLAGETSTELVALREFDQTGCGIGSNIEKVFIKLTEEQQQALTDTAARSNAKTLRAPIDDGSVMDDIDNQFFPGS